MSVSRVGNSKVSENMTFEERPEGSEEANFVAVEGKRLPGGGNSQCKGPGDERVCVTARRQVWLEQSEGRERNRC